MVSFLALVFIVLVFVVLLLVCGFAAWVCIKGHSIAVNLRLPANERKKLIEIIKEVECI